ncbi:hypothetical protein [Bradyrhizobium neotropicale]|uniref:hypothetical protein n=1 Tax=Bradyrhizobium neotropicale TaxID=1497615 RepID=UPI001AD61CB9|nr:hypothetical protein [Bradyrhizobium neotropicale]MBO4228387.1 hypothetical protein [Bradyrhizobium neotropicale]
MLSADGCVEVLAPVDPACCPPPLCGNDLCCTFVAFFNLLPSGPLWDYWKEAAISYFQRSDDPSQCPLLKDPQCPSLILHAIYTVLKLRVMVQGALWVSFRESNPYTAVTTLDDHLARLHWEDCYNQHCRSVLLGEITPLEIMGECGPVFCPPTFSGELELAVKRGVAVALTRANTGIIKNLCALNWVIDPLGAEIIPDLLHVDDRMMEPCDPWGCADARFIVRHSRDWLEGVGSGDVCETHLPRPKVPAYWTPTVCDPLGLPQMIWPGVLAAECIVRSILPCSGIVRSEC